MTEIKKNAFFNVIKTALGILVPLLTFPYVTKILLPENMGKVNWSIKFVEYFSMVASLGISTYAVRECSNYVDDKEKLNKVSSEIYTINVITTIISYILLMISIVIFRKLDSHRTLIIIQSFTIMLSTIGTDWLFQSVGDFKFITIRTIVSQILYVICIFTFVKTSNDYIKYSLISVVTSGLCYIASILYRKNICEIKLTKELNIKKHYKPVLELFVLQLAQVFISNTDVTLLGLLKNDYEVGIYSFAFSIKNLVAQIIDSILWVALPSLSFMFSKKDWDSINYLLSDLFGFFCLLGLPCVIGVISLSREIVLVFSSFEYIEAITPMIILMISFIFTLFGSSFIGNLVLLPSGEDKTYMIITVASAIVNAIANYILISNYNSIGAAIASLVTSVFTLLFMIFHKDKNITINNIYKRFFSPIIGCIAIFMICLLTKSVISDAFLCLVLSVSLSIFVYFIIQFVFRNEILISIINKKNIFNNNK